MALLQSLIVLALCLNVSLACFASGVCGGGCGLPPPPPPTCGGGCGGGYSCGQYGCYRARARAASAKTLSLNNNKVQSPDEKFMECCVDRNLPDSCLNKCSFRTYSKAALQAMYFKQDACPMQAAADIQYCAAQGKDHTECCARNGVTTTLAGSKCLTFCDQRPGNITQLDLTYVACYDRFENMKACFWHDITENAARQTAQESFSEDESPQRFSNRRLGGGARTFHAENN